MKIFVAPKCHRRIGGRLGRNGGSIQASDSREESTDSDSPDIFEYVSGQSGLALLPAPPARRALDCKWN
jgi:hypothetical protein